MRNIVTLEVLWQTIQFLTRPNTAQLRCSLENRLFQITLEIALKAKKGKKKERVSKNARGVGPKE